MLQDRLWSASWRTEGLALSSQDRYLSRRTLKFRHVTAPILVLLFLLAVACQSAGPAASAPTRSEIEHRLIWDWRTVESAEPQLVELDRDFAKLQQSGRWSSRKFLTVGESDELEFLLFRFSALHSALWEIVDAADRPDSSNTDALQAARIHLVASRAALLLAEHTANLVLMFGDDKIAESFMNEPHRRAHLPRDTFLKLCRSVSTQHLQRMEEASRRYDELLTHTDSELVRLTTTDDDARAWLAHDRELEVVALASMKAAVAKLPTADEPGFIRAGGDALHGFEEWAGDELYGLRALTFKNVSRLKSPTASLIKFNDAQKDAVFDELQVGDLIFTYTAGYMSDVFIPGSFKHGFVFVGTPKQRKAAGLSPDVLPASEAYDIERLEANLARAVRTDGRRANVIESVAEGVILNDLAYLMDTHVNRLLVLRPRLSDRSRAIFVTEVFGYLGLDYDFCFDFADASRQVCTELIYRTLSGKDGIEFTLSKRAGHETISADDMVNKYLRGGPFEFVLYAEGDPRAKNHAACVLVGVEGQTRLEALMGDEGGD